MKLKTVAEACMWLPGFAPDEDPNTVIGILGLPVAVDVVACESVSDSRTTACFAPPVEKAVWPRLDASLHVRLGGSVAKFEANTAAIEILRKLEIEGRGPNAHEREALNLYTGWGGLPQAFNESQSDTAWKARSTALKALLTSHEHASAEESTPNAHYTPVEVVEAMWSAVQRLGFKGGRIIEPAGGVGFFIGAMPKEIAQRSRVTAVEIDSVSSRISKQLYGPHGVMVLNAGFEKANLPEGFYDLAISNVPFGAFKVPELRNVPFANFSIHNYFFAKALEVVRPGGLVAFITSSYTMDSHESKVREYLATKADLVAAIRLPEKTFTKVANTSVTTDILILKKHEKQGAHTSVKRRWIVSADPKLTS